jgi:hypothetical protein
MDSLRNAPSVRCSSMREIARAGPAIATLLTIVLVAGIGLPAHAGAPGAPGPDPAPYTPPFELSHPVEGQPGFSDTFGAIRDGGERLHHGIDIGSPLETPVLAAAPGIITRIDSSSTAGLFVEIRHADGWSTRYLHLNDEPPPEPEPGGPALGESPTAESSATTTTTVPIEEPAPEIVGTGIPERIEVGIGVGTGDVIGFVGYSGNAASHAPHLHFELRRPDGTPVNPYPVLTGETGPTTLYVVPDITDEPLVDSMNVLGHVDAGDGFNGPVWGHGGIAYVGSYGTEDACPASGVRRYDIADPAEPIDLDSISADYPGTWTPALWVGDVATSAFSGTLALVAHRLCDPSDTRTSGGLALHDVTDPAAPQMLGFWSAGPGTGAITDFDVWTHNGRLLVGAVVPNSLLDHENALGDVRVIDITDPSDPGQIADWDLRRDVVGEIAVPQVDPTERRAEGITIDSDGRRAFVAYWDAGVAVLDMAAAYHPQLVGWHFPTEHPEGEAATASFDEQSRLIAVTYRDLDPLDDEVGRLDWGLVALLDADKTGEPTLVSVHAVDQATPDPHGRIPLDGIYTPIDALVVDGNLLVASASAGLRIFDVEDPAGPVEIASFVPPTQVDPEGQLVSPNGNIAMPLAWSVHVAGDVILVADLNTGLWILEFAEPRGRDVRRTTTR